MLINSTARADAAIAALAAANRESFERLMELENHAGHALLRAGTATGSTRTRWEAARTDLATLWELHQRHAKTLEALRGLRGRRSQLGGDDLVRVRRMFDGADVPQPPRSTDEVAEAMAAIGARVLDVLRGVEEAWGELGSVLDRCATRLDAVDARLAELEVPPPRTLRTRLDALRAAALDDPLAYWTGATVDTTDVDALEVECARAAESAAELTTLRARADDVLAGADTAAARLEQREWAVLLGRARAAVSVARPAGAAGTRGEPDPPGGAGAAGRTGRATGAAGSDPLAGAGAAGRTGRATGAAGSDPPARAGVAGRPGGAAGVTAADVRAAAERARACAVGGDWRAFARAVADLRATQAAAAARLDALLAAGERPLRTRAELRSLLDLYRVKAAAAGRGEDVPLARLHRAADDLLWTAPTDLAAATAAVDAYRHAVLGNRGTRKDTP